MLKNVFYIIASIILFFSGLIIYGIFLSTREAPLSEIMNSKGIKEIREPRVVVDRRAYKLDLYADGVLVKRYRAIFGKNNNGLKTKADDYITPVGDYRVCKIKDDSQYYKLIIINYPNEKDAGEALKRGLIDEKAFKKIFEANKKGLCPEFDPVLGGDISIHGLGEYDFIFKNLPFSFNWTDGSIALNNSDIQELVEVIKVGTSIKIKY